MSPAGDVGVSGSIMQAIQVLAGLGIVLALAWLALRYGVSRMGGLRSTAGGRIEMVARFGLEPRKTLYLVRAGSELVLLGASETGIHFLKELAGANAETFLGSAAGHKKEGEQ